MASQGGLSSPANHEELVRMNRRAFLKKSLGATAAMSAVSMTGLLSRVTTGAETASLPQMQLYWQKWLTKRPWAPDFDHNGKLWFGRDHFFCTDLDKNTTEIIDNSFMEGKEYSQCFCCGDKIYVVSQKSPHIFAYDQVKKSYAKFALPDEESNIWFGCRVPGDPRLYLYVRNLNRMLVWDSETDRGKVINYPEKTDLWSGFYVPADQAIYSFTLDAKPARLIRFDVKKQRFDRSIAAPETGLEITAMNPIGDYLYCADRFSGRIFPFNISSRTWDKAVTAPGIGRDFGFVGMGCAYQGLALYCLSTYQGKMRYDFQTNTYLSSGEEDIGVDGKPHHFLNKFLVYDPAANSFGYLEATTAGRYPLLCYSIVRGDKLIITGCDIWNAEQNLPDMMQEGELCIFHN